MIIFAYYMLSTLNDWSIPVESRKYPTKNILNPTLPVYAFQTSLLLSLLKLTEIA